MLLQFWRKYAPAAAVARAAAKGPPMASSSSISSSNAPAASTPALATIEDMDESAAKEEVFRTLNQFKFFSNELLFSAALAMVIEWWTPGFCDYPFIFDPLTAEEFSNVGANHQTFFQI